MTIWRFRAKPGNEAEFERAYGSDGMWAELFRTSRGYLGTELLKDCDGPGWYMTIDRWSSRAAFDAFRAETAEYAELDERCEELTDREEHVGGFEVCSAAAGAAEE